MQVAQEAAQNPPSPPSGGASNHTTPSKRKGTDEDSPDATPSKMRRGELSGLLWADGCACTAGFRAESCRLVVLCSYVGARDAVLAHTQPRSRAET